MTGYRSSDVWSNHGKTRSGSAGPIAHPPYKQTSVTSPEQRCPRTAITAQQRRALASNENKLSHRWRQRALPRISILKATARRNVPSALLRPGATEGPRLRHFSADHPLLSEVPHRHTRRARPTLVRKRRDVP